MNTNTTLSNGSWILLNQRQAARAGILLLLLLLTLPAAVQAQFDYTIDNGTVAITKYWGPGGDVTIPDTINGLPVTSIGDRAFVFDPYAPQSNSNCMYITSVTIPDSVTSIGTGGFGHCYNLRSVTMPNSLTSIGTNAFYNCFSLTSVTIPDSVTNIRDGAFGLCFSLTSVAIPNSVSSIGEGTFYNCTSLTNVTIANGVSSMGNYAFVGCTSLTSVTIPSGVIGNAAFNSCSSLISVIIGNGVTNIGSGPFSQCTSLTAIGVDELNPVYSSVDAVLFNKSQTTLIQCPGAKAGTYTIPNSVASIGDGAFDNCASLTSITIPNNVTSIGGNAFNLCTNLTSVTIPNGVTNLGSGAFYRCASLTNVMIGNGVTNVGFGTFWGCSSLASVAIPNSVTSIGSQAFENCTNLTGVYFSGNAPSLGSDGVFYGANNATAYYLPGITGWGSTFGGRPAVPCPVPDWTYTVNSYGTVTITGYTGPGGAATIPSAIYGVPVTGIAGSAFANSSSLASVTIPSTVTSIGTNAFAYCSSLAEIAVDAPNPVYSSVAGVLFNKIQTTLIQCPGGKAGSYTIPNSVISIGTNAFAACSNLASVKIPSSVTSIGVSAFDSCTSLTSMTIPNSVTSIGDYAFYYCTSLTSITIPDSVTSIGWKVFAFCGLTSITIPNSITSIGDYAFYYCDSLTSITIPNSVTSIGACAFYHCDSLTSITIPNSVTSIGGQAFAACGLTSITIPNSVNSIAPQAFSWCQNLTSVSIGNSVTDIGSSAFSDCSGLTNVMIGNSVTRIQDYAFYYCASLTAIIFMGNAPSLAGSWVFFGDNKATVYYLSGITDWGTTFGGRPVVRANPPTIQASPQTQTAEMRSAVTLRVEASSLLPLSYLWYLNSTNLINDSTNRELNLTNLQLSQSGAYTVVVTNAAGAITSFPAMLNVIAAVERRPAAGVNLMGESGSLLNVDYANSLSPAPNWTTLGSFSLASTSQYYFDVTMPLPPQRFYRSWQTGTPGVFPSLSMLGIVPAITLTGAIGGSVRLDYINQFGPIDAWVTLASVPLTNTSQLYFDTTSIGQPARLWRVVPVP